MTEPTFLILHVESPAASGAFYEGLLGQPPLEASATFVMFRLSPGLMLGLWARDGVVPAAATSVGGSELAFTVADAASVDATHVAWRGRGLPILQEPTDMDFGRTFVAADPDGHRLRVFVPAPG